LPENNFVNAFIPFIGVRKFFIRSLTPPQAAGNVLAVQFNLVPDVMCASRQSYSIVTRGKKLAGTPGPFLFFLVELILIKR